MVDTVGITDINKEVSKKNKLSEVQVKEVTASFLEAIKRRLGKGEDISFKGYFTLKRAKKVPKGSKLCVPHTKRMDDFKRANRGKGVVFYARSSEFQKLKTGIKNCKDCKVQKQKLLKTVELLPRINCKASKGIWDR